MVLSIGGSALAVLFDRPVDVVGGEDVAFQVAGVPATWVATSGVVLATAGTLGTMDAGDPWSIASGPSAFLSASVGGGNWVRGGAGLLLPA